MRSFIVAMFYPLFGQYFYLLQAREVIGIAYFFSIASVKSFYKTILNRFPRLDITYFNIIALTPILEVNTSKLKSIIYSYPRWLTPVFNEFIEFSSYSCAGNGYIDSNPKTFSIKIIYDVKCPKTFTL